MEILFYVVAIVAAVLAYTMTPKPPKVKPPSLEDFSFPTAEAGRPVPAVFGEVTVTGPNLVWYGDYEVQTETEDRVKRRFYYMGLHFCVCYGPVDELTEILVGERLAWGAGAFGWTAASTASGTINIFAGNLFGGEDREGGISGTVDVMMGEATQTANTYLTTIQGAPQPGYRGVLSLVANKVYIGANTTYVKPWAFRVRRIEKGWNNDACWYAETANVPGGSTVDNYDIYAAGGEGGTALDYWWKLNTDISAAPEENYGAAGAMQLTYEGSTTPIVAMQSAVTLGTNDELSLRRSGAPGGWLNVPGILIDALNPFTAGGWFNLASSTQQLLFKSNVGGSQGTWRGVDVYCPNTSQIQVVFGDGVGGNYRLTADIAIDATSRHMWALVCQPSAVSLALTIANTKLYVDGVECALTYASGSATGIAWPVTASTPSGWTGVAFDYSSDTYGNPPEGYRDEIFFHWGQLSAANINELYRRGNGGASQSNDMNPAHIIYESITNPEWGMGYPEAVIDDTNFRAAADTFYDEGMGLSLMWTQQSRTEEFIREILDHCAAVLGVDPETGKFILTPLRADYDAGSLTTFDEGEIQAIESFERTGYGELTGEVSVTYRDKSDNKDKTVTVQNLAVIQSQSGVVSESLQFPGISRHELATRVAMRELKARSVPLARGKIKVNRTAWDLIPGGVFKLTWSKLGLTALICRVIEVDTGTLEDGAITVTWIEDVFGLPSSSYAAEQASGWTEPSFTPVAATEQAMVELPYWWLQGAIGVAETAALPASAGYVYPLAKTPQGLSDGHQIWARESSGSPTSDYAEVYADGDWAPSALLDGAVSQSDTSITIDGSSLDVVVIGGLLLVGSGASAEIMRITGGDLETSVTVTRGHLDTTPRDHADNTRLWLLPPRDLRDPAQYSDGDTVDTKLLTITGSGVLDIDDATAASITLDARATRPIAPGNVQVNGEAWPTFLEGTLTVTWAHRDRAVVTSATLQGTTGMASEAGATYNAYVYDATDDSVLDSDAGISGTSWSPTFSHSGTVRVEIESVRDGYASWQRQVRTFEYGDSRVTEAGDSRVTEAGDTRILEG